CRHGTSVRPGPPTTRSSQERRWCGQSYSAHLRRAAFDRAGERAQAPGVASARRGGVALQLGGQRIELSRETGGALILRGIRAVERGLHGTGAIRPNGVAARELIEVRARDEGAVRPGEALLFLHVQLVDADQ